MSLSKKSVTLTVVTRNRDLEKFAKLTTATEKTS